MVRACTLVVAMLLGAAPALPAQQEQGSSDKSTPPAQPAPQTPPASEKPQPEKAPDQTSPSRNAPQPDQSEAPPAEHAQPPAQNESGERPKEAPPEEKKAAPCDQDKAKCGSNPASKPRRVVRHGSTGAPTAQLAPGMTPEQALRHRQLTEQLLSSAEGNLQQLAKRSLNQGQQDTISQIRNYMAGSRSALEDGDLLRARTLAFKAHLLADDLLKH